MLDEAMWVFKWFITCFIYSFPIEVVRYIWDIIIERGGIGLVYVSVAVVLLLSQKLKEMEDGC